MDKKELTDEEIVNGLEHKKKIILEEVNRTNNCLDDLIVCVDAELIFGVLDLIHRLQDDYSKLKERYIKVLDLNEKVIADQNAEIERLNKCVMSEVQVRKCCEDIIHETIKKTVNDMGKEIYKRVTDSLRMWLRERYDVEVE